MRCQPLAKYLMVFVVVFASSIHSKMTSELFHSANTGKRNISLSQESEQTSNRVQMISREETTILTTLNQIPPPKFLTPANNSVLKPENFPIEWQAVPNVQYYTLQVSMSPHFNPILQSARLTVTSATVAPQNLELKDGDNDLYARVDATTKAGTSEWSDYLRVIIRKGQNISPSAPTLISPQNFAVNQAIALSLKWQPSSGATSYSVQIATVSDFAVGTIVSDQKDLTATSTTIDNLKNGQDYYWRVAAKNDAGVSNWSTVFKFSTLSVTPQPPQLVFPVTGALNIPLSTSVSWKSVAGAESYTLQISNTENFSQVLINQTGIKDSSFVLNALFASTTYFWRVQAVNSSGSSAWSFVWSFTTGASVQNIPKLLLPKDSSVEQPLNVLLSWNLISASAGIAYTVQISNSPTFSSLLVNITTLASTSYQVNNGLSPNTQYYWRVNTTVQSVTSNWSDIWSFKTTGGAVVVPQLVAPLNGSNNNPLSLTFVWKSGSMPYTFQIARSIDFSTNTIIVSNNSLQTPTITIRDLKKNTTYYWRVGSSVSNSTIPLWSEVWSVITTSSDSLTVPSLVSPLNESNNQPLSVSFTWNPTVNAHKYLIHVSTAADFASDKIIAADGSLTAPTVTINGLQKSCVYYWRVCGIDSMGTAGIWSSIWSFSTIKEVLPLPEKPSLMYPLNNAAHVAFPVTMVWNSSENATSYGIQIALSKDFLQNTIIFDSSAISSTYFEMKKLGLSMVYYWRVVALNSSGAGSWSDVWTFSTQKNTNIIENSIGKKSTLSLTASEPLVKNKDAYIEFKCTHQESLTGTICVYDCLGHAIYRANVFLPGKSESLTRCAIWNLRNSQGKRVSHGMYTVLLCVKNNKGIRYYSTCMIGVQQ